MPLIPKFRTTPFKAILQGYRKKIYPKYDIAISKATCLAFYTIFFLTLSSLISEIFAHNESSAVGLTLIFAIFFDAPANWIMVLILWIFGYNIVLINKSIFIIEPMLVLVFQSLPLIKWFEDTSKIISKYYPNILEFPVNSLDIYNTTSWNMIILWSIPYILTAIMLIIIQKFYGNSGKC